MRTLSLLSILFIAASTAAADTASIKNTQVFLNPIISGSEWIPLGNSSQYWKKYQTAGLHIEFPSGLNGLSWDAELEAGRIQKFDNSIKISCLHLLLGVKYQFLFPGKLFYVSPQIGLASMMISSQEIPHALEDVDVFKDVENEFGFSFGLEPGLRYKRFFFGVPIKCEKILSSPDNFDLLSLSFIIGYNINL